MIGIVSGAAVGALLGLGADRLSARWPLHEDGKVRRADWRTAVVMLGGAAAFAGLAARWSDPRDLLVLGLYVGALIVLLGTDLDQRLLPDVITLPLIGYALLVLVAGVNPLLADKAQVVVAGDVTAVLAAVLAPAFLLVTDRVFHGALGMGDVKLSVSLGLMAGLTALIAGFLVATLAFAVVVLLLVLAKRIGLRTAIPFGPALIAAGVIATLLPGA
jgi:leader peptidase (prepilin peptidase)/N-methyltransferase